MTPLQNNKKNDINAEDVSSNSKKNVPDDMQDSSDTSSADLNISIDKPEEEIVLEEIHSHHHHHGKKMKVSSSGKITYKKRKHHSKKKNRKSKKKNTLKKVLIGFLIFLIVAIVGLFSAYLLTKKLGKNEFLNKNKQANINTINNADSKDDGRTVVYKGHTYRYNENLISIVFLGIDQSELGSKPVGTSGQADAIYIFTYDTDSKKCSLIPVSRETMTDVQMYSASGKALTFEKMQLCLAYAYGDGKESSCKNTLDALSRIFYNIPFDACISLNWDSIGPLNDVLGGVTLKSLENVPTKNSVIPKDEYITLTGDEAWSYVKYRDTSKLTSNVNRLSRQKQYINAYLTKLIPMAKSNFSVIRELYNTANAYMYTTLSGNQIIYTASEILPNVYSSKDFDFVSIGGKIKQGDTYAEFYPDETALYEAILKVFYTKIK